MFQGRDEWNRTQFAVLAFLGSAFVATTIMIDWWLSSRPSLVVLPNNFKIFYIIEQILTVCLVVYLAARSSSWKTWNPGLLFAGSMIVLVSMITTVLNVLEERQINFTITIIVVGWWLWLAMLIMRVSMWYRRQGG